MNRIYKISEAVSLIFIPAFLVFCGLYGIKNAGILSFVAVVAALIPFILHFEHTAPKPRDIMPVVVMAAAAAAGRFILFALPDIKPVTAIIVMAGISFGRQSGFMAGVLAAVGSNIWFGQGIWTPWQMYAWGIAGFLAGLLYEKGLIRSAFSAGVYGFISAVVYGFLMDTYYVVGFVYPVTLSSAIAAYALGLKHTIVHAVSTAVMLPPLYLLLAGPMERIKVKFGIR